MVTVKRESSIESAGPADSPRHDVNSSGGIPSRTPDTLFPLNPNHQTPWWKPATKLIPGPQKAYESQFQVKPPLYRAFGRVFGVPYNAKPNQVRMVTGEDYANALSKYEKQEAAETASGNQAKIPVDLDEQNRHQESARLLMKAQQEQFRRNGMSSSSLDSRYEKGRHIQLMLSDQQNKRQLRMSPQEQNSIVVANHPVSTSESMPVKREQSVESVWSVQFTPEPTPGLQEGYESQFQSEPCPSKREQSVESDWSTQFTPESTPGLQERSTNQYPQEYQKQLEILEQYCKRGIARARQQQGLSFNSLSMPPPPSSGNRALQDYQMQKMLLEQNSKKQHTKNDISKGKGKATNSYAAAPQPARNFGILAPSSGLVNPTQQELSIPPKPLEMQKRDQASALQDHEMQLLLLQQQNKRRIMAARSPNADPPLASPPPPGASAAYLDLERQLLNMEEQNRKRLNEGHFEALAQRNVKQKTMQSDPAVVPGGSPASVVDVRSEIERHKPLVIREKHVAED